MTFITRLRLDAALYEPAPPRRPGQRGRPRLKGERLPNLSELADDPRTFWKLTTITNWYGERERMVEIASQTAVWYSTGLFAVPVRWVFVMLMVELPWASRAWALPFLSALAPSERHAAKYA